MPSLVEDLEDLMKSAKAPDPADNIGRNEHYQALLRHLEALCHGATSRKALLDLSTDDQFALKNLHDTVKRVAPMSPEAGRAEIAAVWRPAAFVVVSLPMGAEIRHLVHILMHDSSGAHQSEAVGVEEAVRIDPDAVSDLVNGERPQRSSTARDSAAKAIKTMRRQMDTDHDPKRSYGHALTSKFLAHRGYSHIAQGSGAPKVADRHSAAAKKASAESDRYRTWRKAREAK